MINRAPRRRHISNPAARSIRKSHYRSQERLVASRNQCAAKGVLYRPALEQIVAARRRRLWADTVHCVTQASAAPTARLWLTTASPRHSAVSCSLTSFGQARARSTASSVTATDLANFNVSFLAALSQSRVPFLPKPSAIPRQDFAAAQR